MGKLFKMEKNIIGFVLMLIFMSFLWFNERNRPPSTKNFYISLKIKGTSLQKYMVDCGGTSGGVISETCLLSEKPEIAEIDEALKNTGWSDFSGNRDTLYDFRGWCRDHGRILSGQGKKGWQITYLFDMKFDCPG